MAANSLSGFDGAFVSCVIGVGLAVYNTVHRMARAHGVV